VECPTAAKIRSKSASECRTKSLARDAAAEMSEMIEMIEMMRSGIATRCWPVPEGQSIRHTGQASRDP